MEYTCFKLYYSPYIVDGVTTTDYSQIVFSPYYSEMYEFKGKQIFFVKSI
jgi:hypothetical protein